ncbi:MAG: glycerophosphodiester phosphodiesterase family protein [Hyphomonadaceae bacterium]
MRRIALAAVLALAACDAEVGGVKMSVGGDAAPALAPSDLPAFFDCLRESGQTIVAAHRGGPSPGFAENAIPTFENTVRQAPALLEIDIARTRDNQLVLMHDDTVDRTTTGAGEVRSLTLAQVQALQLQDDDGQILDARVPTFREALDWAEGRAILELDVKRGVAYEDVIAEVRAANAASRVIFITYSDAAAERVHRLAPELMLGVSIDDERDLDTLADRGVDLSRVLAWTGVDEPNSALNLALAQRGVEAAFGTLGNPDRSWDGRFAREGQDQYAAFAETGIQVIATDRPIQASADLDANDGAEGVAAMQCAATPR